MEQAAGKGHEAVDAATDTAYTAKSKAERAAAAAEDKAQEVSGKGGTAGLWGCANRLSCGCVACPASALRQHAPICMQETWLCGSTGQALGLGCSCLQRWLVLLP